MRFIQIFATILIHHDCLFVWILFWPWIMPTLIYALSHVASKYTNTLRDMFNVTDEETFLCIIQQFVWRVKIWENLGNIPGQFVPYYRSSTVTLHLVWGPLLIWNFIQKIYIHCTISWIVTMDILYWQFGQFDFINEGNDR